MTKTVTTQQTQLNLAVVALVALVAIVGLVALVMNAENGQFPSNGLAPVLDSEGNQVGFSFVDLAASEPSGSAITGKVTQADMRLR